MKSILYRAKAINRNPNRTYRTDYQNGDWVYGLVSRLDEYSAEMTNADGVSGIDVDPETICEYTGLTDKNGNMIFEGDIVRYSDEECYYPEEYTEFVGDIVFEKGAFGIGSRDELPIDLDYWCDNDNFVSLWELYWNLNCVLDELSMLEVIGNIHDNPELLEK